jgi:hypothetical protein
MAYIEDRWYAPQRDAEGNLVLNGKGKPVMAPTDRHGRGMRYRARYDGPDGRERSKSFANGEKKKAEDFLLTVGSDLLRGTYIDPAAAQMPFADFAESWLRTHACDESTRESMEIRVRKHIIPFSVYSRSQRSSRASSVNGIMDSRASLDRQRGRLHSPTSARSFPLR